MKSTQVTELFANIKKTFVSFFSILMFVALGVGVFLGISWTSPALQTAAEKVFDEGAYHNFQIVFPYGLTEGDLAKLSEVEGVTSVETARQSFQTVTVGEREKTVKVQTLGQDIDKPIVRKGELPSKADEIALHEASAATLGLDVGDTITFMSDAGQNANDLLTMSLPSDPEGAASEDAKPASDGASVEDDGMAYLNGATYKVTALIDSPDYLALASETYGISQTPTGTVDALAWVTADAWDASAFLDAYPLVNVRSDSLAGMGTYTDEYKAASSSIKERISELGDALGTARYDDLHGQAQAKIDEVEAKLAEGKKGIADGEKQLKEGRETLERERSEGEAKLASAYEELQGYEYQKTQAEYQLAAVRSKVEEGEALLAEADALKAEAESSYSAAVAYEADLAAKLKKGKITLEEYNAALDEYGKALSDEVKPLFDQLELPAPTIDHENFLLTLSIVRTALDGYEDIPIEYEGETMTIGEARAKLADARQQVEAGEYELYQKSIQLEEGWAQYYAGQETLKTMVAEGEQRIADGEKQLEDVRRQVAENEPKLADAKESLAQMAKYDWTVLSRAQSAGAAQVSVFGNVTTNLSFSMAALFVIVGLLVSYSAVSRIVHEQITQIGTKKALGFRAKEITRSYLAYSAIAVIAGAIVGAIVGLVVVEGIIGSALGNMFIFGDFPPHFGLLLFLIVTALELALVLGSTWIACRGILKEQAVELLKGEKPPAAKEHFYEKWGIWERANLFTQTIINNCINEKRRLFSTVVGVAGCTALIVVAITLNNDVMKSYDRQYDEVYGFDAVAYVKNEPAGAADKVEAVLKDQGCETTQVVRKRYAIEQPDGDTALMNIIAPVDEAAFAERYAIKPLSGGEVDLSQDGAWVTRAYAEHLGAKVGDEVSIDTGDGVKHKVKILGFYEFFLTYHEMVMGYDAYVREFGETAPNVVLADTGGTAIADLEKAASSVDGYYSIINDKEFQHVNFEMFSSVSNAVVAIYLALAVLMAIVVLLNLNIMFINEKKRELIVLMINGFSTKFAKRYIYSDTIVLSAIGIICGLILGCIMGSVTVGSIEPSTATFDKGIDLMAVVIGIVGSAVLSLVMSLIALRRIPRFALTDINRF